MRTSSLAKLLLVPVLVLSASLPAAAGPKEQAMLEGYVGTWRGSSMFHRPDFSLRKSP